MTKKDSQSDKEKLWSKSFEEDFTEVPYSRSAKKKAEKGISPITKTILIFGILILVVPISAYLWWAREDKEGFKSTADTADSHLVVNKNDTTEEVDSSKEKEEKEKADAEKAEAEKAKAEAEAEKEKIKQEQAEAEKQEQAEAEQRERERAEAEQKEKNEAEHRERERIEAEQKQQAEQEQVQAESENVSGNTYTVQAGDNLYRIALKHNMTTEELKAKNGISGNEITVGQVLKVN